MPVRKILAFFKRDLVENLSYRAFFLSEVVGIFATALTFFFISKLFHGDANLYLRHYGGSYFPFVIIGIAFSGYQTVALSSFPSTVSKEQETGTLEAILITPTGIGTVLLAGAIWNFFYTSLRVVTYCWIGSIVFGMHLSRANLPTLCLVAILTVVSLAGLGLISAGFTLVYKRGDPVNFIFAGFSKLLGGVYFPVAVLPLWMQKASLFTPLTHSLEAFRKTILLGESVLSLGREITALVLFSIVLFPIGLAFWDWSVKRAKREGTLVCY